MKKILRPKIHMFSNFGKRFFSYINLALTNIVDRNWRHPNQVFPKLLEHISSGIFWRINFITVRTVMEWYFMWILINECKASFLISQMISIVSLLEQRDSLVAARDYSKQLVTEVTISSRLRSYSGYGPSNFSFQCL